MSADPEIVPALAAFIRICHALDLRAYEVMRELEEAIEKE